MSDQTCRMDSKQGSIGTVVIGQPLCIVRLLGKRSNFSANKSYCIFLLSSVIVINLILDAKAAPFLLARPRTVARLGVQLIVFLSIEGYILSPWCSSIGLPVSKQ